MTAVEHLVVEIKAKSLPFKEALGSDPYFRLVNPKLLKKNKRKSDRFHVIYESECVQNCHEPQWLAINFYSDKHDFDQELILEIYDNVNFHFPVYIGSSSFKISDFREQFIFKNVDLSITEGGLTCYDKAPTRPSHPYQGAPYLKLRRQLQTTHGSKTSNAPCFEEVMGNIFYKRSHEVKTIAFWEKLNAKRAKEEEEFLKKLREQFDHFDIDGNGTIDDYEMFTIIPEVWGGRTVTHEEVLDIIREVDVNFDGVVDFDEFRQCVKVLDRRYAARIAEEKKADRMKRLEEREKTQWERDNEMKKEQMLAAQEEFIKNMEEKAAKKAEEKRKQKELLGEEYEEPEEIEEEKTPASSVYDVEPETVDFVADESRMEAEIEEAAAEPEHNNDNPEQPIESQESQEQPTEDQQNNE